jgi:hypothetical protein
VRTYQIMLDFLGKEKKQNLDHGEDSLCC